MVHIFDMFYFGTLLMWIFETTNRLHGSKSGEMYAGVELSGDPLCKLTVHRGRFLFTGEG